MRIFNTNDSCDFNVDSLKWIAYSINYNKSAFINHDTNLKINSIVECDIKIVKNQSKNNDTCFYGFYYFKENESNVCFPTDGYYDIIGLISKDKHMFPMHSIVNLYFITNSDSCRKFFHEKGEMFKEYLREYKGNISPWLRQEAIKRKIQLGSVSN